MTRTLSVVIRIDFQSNYKPNKKKCITLPEEAHRVPDLLIEAEKSHLGLDWDSTQDVLHREAAFMLPLKQYAKFLRLLKSGKPVYDGNGQKLSSQRVERVLSAILTPQSGYTVEHLDARFTLDETKKGSKLFISYHRICADTGTLKLVCEQLHDCLMSDRSPGISLDYWLKNATSQGLPPTNTLEGQLYYWSPRANAVAGFDADSGRAVLYCGGDASNSGASLGVRRAFFRQ